MSALADSLKSAEKALVPAAVASGVILLAAALAIPILMRRRLSVDESARLSGPQQTSDGGRPESLALHDSATVSLPSAGLVSSQLKSAAPAAAKAPNASVDRKIVRTGALELTVNDPAAAAERIRLMAEGMGGYLESAQVGGTREAPVANVTIRVPSTHFEDAKAGIRKLAARVENEKTNAQDVTRQYVDMEARLRNLRAEEAQYLAIMKSAFKVDDLLEVSLKMSEVRGEIEQQQAEFQALSKQVATVAITVSLRAVADAQVFGLNWRPLYQLKVAARDGLDALADYGTAMAAILFYVPVILAWSLTILFAVVLGWRIIRWTGRRFFDWPGPAMSEKAAGSV